MGNALAVSAKQPARPQFVSWLLSRPWLQGISRKIYLHFKSFLLHIDRPQTREISDSICVIDGWFAWKAKALFPSLKINHAAVMWIPVDRPDVKQALPAQCSQGFRIVVDTSRFFTGAIRSGESLKLQLAVNEEIIAEHALRLTAAVIHEPTLSEDQRRAKQQWLKDRLACPLCPAGSGTLEFSDAVIRCRSCGETFADKGSVLDFLPRDLRLEFRVENAHDISTHHYDEVAIALIENARRIGGKVLDCGAGLRQRVDEAVICVEIAPFPAVDVLAVNQKLPFQNEVFDSVLSLNVLEHVTDPFACAAELVRVLKPGGTLYCCIPFLQPEHGYPHHYFNATRSGLRELFPEEFEVLQHLVPRSGEPIWTLQWFLSRYVGQLPPGERQTFLNLRMKDVVDKPAESLLQESWVRDLSPEGKWMLASTTAAVFRKPPLANQP